MCQQQPQPEGCSREVAVRDMPRPAGHHGSDSSRWMEVGAPDVPAAAAVVRSVGYAWATLSGRSWEHPARDSLGLAETRAGAKIIAGEGTGGICVPVAGARGGEW